MARMPRPLRILIAPDAFKECMTAREAAEAMERGVKRTAQAADVRVKAVSLPVSDGGAGLVDAMFGARPHNTIEAGVSGPLGEPLTLRIPDVREPGGGCLTLLIVGAALIAAKLWGGVGLPWLLIAGITGGAAWIVSSIPKPGRDRFRVIEASAAAGLALVPPHRRDPERASTHGVGELLRVAATRKTSRILFGVGNTATCDGGVGMLAALGVRFFDAKDAPIERPSGADLARIARIDASDLHTDIRATKITVLCDVDNPLFGPNGAAHVFAPQKGASPEQVERLDAGLRNLARRCAEAGLDTDPDAPGAGAAGGLGFALRTFCGASLERGIEYLLQGEFEEAAWESDLVLTGAGRLDATDLRGKAILGVSNAAARVKVPTIALVGSIGPGADDCFATRPDGSPGLEGGLHAYHVITPPGMPLDEALRRGPELLEAAAERVVREWLMRR